MCVGVDIAISFVMEWVLKMHLFSMNWVGVVVLPWCDDIDKAKTVYSPLIWIYFLMELMVSLWDIVMVR